MSDNKYYFDASAPSINNQRTQNNLTGINKDNQNQYNSGPKQTLAKVANDIEILLDYFKDNNPTITEAEKIVNTARENQPELLVVETIEKAINSNSNLKQRIGAGGKATYIETVKLFLPPLGIAIEAVQAFNNLEN